MKCRNMMSELDEFKDNGLIVKDDKYYYRTVRGKTQREYLGVDGEVVRGIQSYRFWNNMNKDIEREVRLLEGFLHKFSPVTITSTMENLPKVYQREGGLLGLGFSNMDDWANDWIKRNTKLKESYPRVFPEYLTKITLSGECVRSKSELAYYNYLYTEGYPFIYELPLVIDGEVIYPDFSILRLRDKRTIYHEHAGLTSEGKYSARFIHKLAVLSGAGIYSPHNLIITTETENGEVDMVTYKRILELMLE